MILVLKFLRHLPRKMPTLFGQLRAWMILIAIAVTLPTTGWAQGVPTTAASPATGQAAPGTPTAIPTVRPMTMEVIIVLLMVGAALFVVCKSSRRN